jgi:hypothetical protein
MQRLLKFWMFLILVIGIINYPLLAQDFSTNSNGAVAIEAEQYSTYEPGTNAFATDSWSFDDAIAGFSGTGYMEEILDDAGNGDYDFADKPELKYTIDFDEIGDYDVYAYCLTPDNGTDKSLLWGVDSVAQNRIDYWEGTNNEWGWDKSGGDNGRNVYFTLTEAGTHTFSMITRQPNFKVDKVVIAKKGTFDPANIGSSALTDLTMNVGALDQEFASGTTSYTVEFPNNTTSVILNVEAEDPLSTVTGTGEVAISSDGGTLDIVVDGYDNGGQTTYTITYTVSTEIADADGDGVADHLDICPLGDDNVDLNNNGIPDACDVYVQEQLDGTTGVLFEAEDTINMIANASEQVWLFEDTQAGYEGDGYIVTYSSSGYGNYADAPVAQYAIDLNSTGTYYLYARVYFATASNDSFHFGLKDGDVTTYNVYPHDPYAEWHWHNFGSFTVNETGVDTLNIYQRDYEARIDQILLTTNGEFDPANIGSTELSSLTLSEGTLSPAFDPATLSYSVILPGGTESVVVGGQAKDVLAVVNGDGEINLNVGSNQVDVTVAGTTTYSIEITVESLIPDFYMESEALLFEAEDYTSTIAGINSYTGESFEIQTSQTGWVGGTGYVEATSIVDDMVNSDKAQMTYIIDFANAGTYEIFSFVNAPSETEKSVYYTLNGDVDATNNVLQASETTGTWHWATGEGTTNMTVERGARILSVFSRESNFKLDRFVLAEEGTFNPTNFGSSDLASLELSVGDLSPAFDAATTSYEVTFPVGTKSVDITATTLDMFASVEGDGSITLSPDGGTLNVVVTDYDEVSSTTYSISYTVEVGPTYVMNVNNAVLFEAEKYSNIDAGSGDYDGWAWSSGTTETGFSGEGYVFSDIPNGEGSYSPDKPQLFYTIDFAEAGDYEIWFRVFWANDDSDSFYYGIGDENSPEPGCYGDVDEYGFWLWKKGNNGRSVELAGENDLVVEVREPGAHIDQIIVVTDEVIFTPDSLGSTALTELSLSVGELSPAFSPEITSYDVTFPLNTTSVDVTASAADVFATISGDAAVDLSTEGTIDVMIDSYDGLSSTTYTITYTVILDTDNDGVTDDIDVCPDTPAGVEVDADGCEVPLGTFDQTNMNVYPNPVQDILTVQFVNKVQSITIYSITGKMMKTIEVSNQSSLQIDVSDLSFGIYTIKSIGDDNHALRFIKR